MEEETSSAQDKLRFLMEDLAGMRLDRALSIRMGISRSRAQAMINQGLVEVDGRKADKDYRILGAEEVAVLPLPVEKSELEPKPIPLRIVYQDEYIAVVSKQAGLVVHPAAGHRDDTLVNALLHAMPDLGSLRGEIRPGIVHRLDRDTSGLMVVAKNEESLNRLQQAVRERLVRRVYIALVHGSMASAIGTVEAPVGRDRRHRKKMAVVEGGKHAITHYRVLEHLGDFTLLEVELETGRTHQIRVHMSFIGHPVAGDAVYGRGDQDRRLLGLERQFLHACSLTFPHPASGKLFSFRDELPEDLQEVLEKLRLRSNGRGAISVEGE